MALCDYALEVAEDEAKKQLNSDLVNLMFKISDEIVATAEECESKEEDEP